MTPATLDIKHDLPLRACNTLNVASVAQYACVVTTPAQLREALAFAQQRDLPVHLLGGGSNLILAPRITGLVCRIALRGVQHQLDGDRVRVTVAAGEQWHQFVRYSLGQGWSGLEALSLIPGQVGAAPLQNIGAYGAELSDWLESVQVLHRPTDSVQQLSAAQCQFDYRNSLFKKSPDYAVLAVSFRLCRSGQIAAKQYPDVQRELDASGRLRPSARDIAEAVIRVRRRKLPDHRLLGNVGSVFKNPVVSAENAAVLQQQLTQLVRFQLPGTNHVKLSAAQLIDRAGWKGVSRYGFKVWPRQPLVIVNERGAGDGNGMLQLAQDIAMDVEQRFAVALEMEPRVMGFAASP